MASVVIHGFENDKEAKEFISWFSGQGEQDIVDWWCARAYEEELKSLNFAISPKVDDLETYYPNGGLSSGVQTGPIKDENDNWVMQLVRNP